LKIVYNKFLKVSPTGGDLEGVTMNKAASVYKAKFSLVSGCCFFMLIGFALHTNAQTRGKVEVVKDARIDSFAAKRATLNKLVGTEATSANGFRVQIYTGSDRREAYDAQAKFHEQFPDTHTYVIYSEPNFKVRAGDFRTRLEAEKMQEELKKTFSGMFIISEKINPSASDE
jgi:hypothetical protein